MTASPRTAAPATLGAMPKTTKKFRIRRIDLAPDDRLPDEPMESRETAERVAEELYGPGWRGEHEVYQYSSGTTIPTKDRQRGKTPLATYSLPAEDIAYVRELAERTGRTLSSIIREGIALVRKKNKD